MPFPNEDQKFKPGESGNPAGRPVGSLNRSTIVRRWLEAKGQNGTVADDITLAMVEQALDGNVQAWDKLLDSAYGKITDKTELTGADGGAVGVAFTVEHVKTRKD